MVSSFRNYLITSHPTPQSPPASPQINGSLRKHHHDQRRTENDPKRSQRPSFPWEIRLVYPPSKNYSQHALHTKRGMGKCENIIRRYDEPSQKTNIDAPQTYQRRTSHKRRQKRVRNGTPPRKGLQKSPTSRLVSTTGTPLTNLHARTRHSHLLGRSKTISNKVVKREITRTKRCTSQRIQSTRQSKFSHLVGIF